MAPLCQKDINQQSFILCQQLKMESTIWIVIFNYLPCINIFDCKFDKKSIYKYNITNDKLYKKK
jgi:hypothetical protein